jgi:hypothetical protein
LAEIGLVHDLRDELHALILDPEALDERLEGAVFPVVAEVGAQHVKRDALARGVSSIGERERRAGIAEPLDEPGRRDAVDVGPRPRSLSRSWCSPWTDLGVHVAPILVFTFDRSQCSPWTETRIPGVWPWAATRPTH